MTRCLQCSIPLVVHDVRCVIVAKPVLKVAVTPALAFGIADIRQAPDRLPSQIRQRRTIVAVLARVAHAPSFLIEHQVTTKAGPDDLLRALVGSIAVKLGPSDELGRRHRLRKEDFDLTHIEIGSQFNRRPHLDFVLEAVEIGSLNASLVVSSRQVLGRQLSGPAECQRSRYDGFVDELLGSSEESRDVRGDRGRQTTLHNAQRSTRTINRIRMAIMPEKGFRLVSQPRPGVLADVVEQSESLPAAELSASIPACPPSLSETVPQDGFSRRSFMGSTPGEPLGCTCHSTHSPSGSTFREPGTTSISLAIVFSPSPWELFPQLILDLIGELPPLVLVTLANTLPLLLMRFAKVFPLFPLSRPKVLAFSLVRFSLTFPIELMIILERLTFFRVFLPTKLLGVISLKLPLLLGLILDQALAFTEVCLALCFAIRSLFLDPIRSLLLVPGSHLGPVGTDRLDLVDELLLATCLTSLSLGVMLPVPMT